MQNKYIVTTTINKPTEAIHKFDNMPDWKLIVVGDKKTPSNYNLTNGIYISPEDQENHDKDLSDAIGWNCIQRRNFGLLKAHQLDAEIIATIDDDNIPYWLGALISFGIVVVYVATSGVRGAAWSDVFQAILMLLIAWVLGMYFVEKLHGGIGSMFSTITSENSEFLLIGQEGSAMTKARYSSNIIISMIGFVMWPHLFTKSYTTTEKRIKTTVAVYPIFALFLLPVLFIGFSGYGIVSSDQIENSGQILPYLITNYLTDSGLLYGIVGAGALAAAMSSSDAITHGASVSFGRDICKVIYPNLSESTELWIMRGAVFAVGGVAYLLAIFGSP